MQKTGPEDGSLYAGWAENFRPKHRKQALGTEVSKGTGHETSVQNAENEVLVRKSARVQDRKLPYKTPKTRHWYGSQQGYRTGNFRTKRRKQALDTEVGKRMDHETSVQNAENGALVRKSARVQGTKLPSKMPKTGLWYGSQQAHGS